MIELKYHPEASASPGPKVHIQVLMGQSILSPPLRGLAEGERTGIIFHLYTSIVALLHPIEPREPGFHPATQDCFRYTHLDRAYLRLGP